ncbi:serine/threonine-protein kinase [Kribbella sp. NPDC023855]|uniref:serine/threonine-protein kinase n=1 Tax=Kribbella sp. NPDC023855 TaxID=3154698 RepID=UPI0033EE788C
MKHIGRYRLDHRVGSGAFATVWKGYDPELDTAVAVKVLADNWVLHADVRERFLSEARLLRRIESRRVVRVHDVGVDDNRPYFVMDYVNGGTLAECVGQVEPAEALRLAAEAAEAVQVLHEAGFIHRDIKPSNLLLDKTSEPARVLVADLGSVKRLADATGYTVNTGTPAYMAPEQTGGIGTFDGRADVYSLAVVTWELLTGDRPAPDLSTSSGRSANWRPQRRPVAEIDGVSPRVVDVLTTALDPDPDTRPQDAQTFARELLAANDAAAPPQPSDWPAPLVWTAALAVFGLATLTAWLVL